MNPDLVRLVSQSALPAGAPIAAGVVALLSLLLTAYGLRRMPPSRKTALLALRSVGLACALMLVLQPAVRRERRANVPSRVVVLLDQSASMSLPDSSGSTKARVDVARALARAATSSDVLRAPDRSIEVYALSASGGKPGADAPVAIPLAALDDRPARGATTRIAEALAALPRVADRDLAGVIVLSDGADHGRLGANAPHVDENTRSLLQGLGAPVHTVTIGDPDVQDLIVAGVSHDDFAFVRTPISFEAKLEALGAAQAGWVGKRVPVVLRRDGLVVATENVTLTGATEGQKVTFHHVPDRVGEFVFDVSTPALQGELTPLNNVARFELRVVRDRVRVLQVCGRPSWDERFLRSLFKRDPNVDLISFFILRTPNAIEVATTDELSLIPFPTDELFRESLHTFDLVVLQNFDYGPYQMATYLPEIRRYVEEGGALAMLGGELSFDAGGYAGTPIEAILPVELGVQAGSGQKNAAAIDVQRVHPKLTAAGKTHPLTALALNVEESAKLFAELPPIDGVNLVRRAKPDATVLAVHPTLLDADRQPLPIISVREAGRGRVLAVGSDSTWRWMLEGPSHGSRRPYERFWESAIRWLVRDPALSLLRLDVERTEAGLSARATTVGPDYSPVANAPVTFSLEEIGRALDAPRASALPPPAPGTTDAQGRLDRPIATLPEGSYRLHAKAVLGGRPIEDDKIFLVSGGEAELSDPQPRPALLAALSTITGGTARKASDGLRGLSFKPPREIRVAASEDRALWSTPWVLLVGFASWALAWGLGRRWGRR